MCGVGSIGDGGRKVTGVRGERRPGHEDIPLVPGRAIEGPLNRRLMSPALTFTRITLLLC